MRNIFLCTLFLSLAACQNVPVWQYEMFQKPPGNRMYHADYVKGWQDGCESGAQSAANHLFRFKYKYRQDWRMLDNQQYVSGWEAAYSHCRKYIYQHNMETLGN